MSSALVTCSRCEGCGRIASSADGEPWTAWENLQLRSAGAVIAGLVRPILCPACGGTGRIAAPPDKRRTTIENTIDDLMGSLLYYDRKADDDLPMHALEQAIVEGVIDVEEISERMRAAIQQAVNRYITEGPLR